MQSPQVSLHFWGQKGTKKTSFAFGLIRFQPETLIHSTTTH